MFNQTFLNLFLAEPRNKGADKTGDTFYQQVRVEVSTNIHEHDEEI